MISNTHIAINHHIIIISQNRNTNILHIRMHTTLKIKVNQIMVGISIIHPTKMRTTIKAGKTHIIQVIGRGLIIIILHILQIIQSNRIAIQSTTIKNNIK